MPPPLRLALSNVIWLIAERSLQIALLLIIGGLIARNFGPELFGKWQYALTLLTIATTLTYLCGAEVIVPKLVRCPEDAGEILGTAFTIRITASLVGFFLAQLLVEILISDQQTASFIKALLALLFLYEPFAVVTAWFQSRTHIAPIVKIRLAALALKCFFVVLIFRLSLNQSLVAYAWIGEGAFLAICFIFLYRVAAGPKWQATKASTTVFIKEGAVYWIALLFMVAFTRTDRFFLAEFSSFSALGVYSSAIQVSETWFTLAGLLSQSFAPRYVFSSDPKPLINKNLMKMLSAYVAVAFVGSTIIFFSAKLIVDTIFGPAYSDAIPILQASAFISILVFVDSVFNSLMLKERAARWVVAKWIAAFACALSVNIFLFRSLGVYAPLLGLFVGYFVVCLIGLVYWSRWRGEDELGR